MHKSGENTLTKYEFDLLFEIYRNNGKIFVKKLQEWIEKAKSPDFIVSITAVNANQWMVTILKVR